MARLMGKSPATIDSKGRVSLPAKYRKHLPEELVVVTKDPDKEFPALAIYSQDDFDTWMDEVLSGKGGYQANDKNQVLVITKYYGDAEELRVDSAGRILLPADLREYARIDKDVMFTGVRDHLTLRNIDIWKAYQESLEEVTAFDEQPAHV